MKPDRTAPNTERTMLPLTSPPLPRLVTTAGPAACPVAETPLRCAAAAAAVAGAVAAAAAPG